MDGSAARATQAGKMTVPSGKRRMKHQQLSTGAGAVYIYALRDPRDDAFHYIGLSRNLRARLQAHMYADSGGEAKMEWIEDLMACGLRPELVVLEQTDEDHCQEAERRWIRWGHENQLPLANGTSGGEMGNGIGGRLSFACIYPLIPSELHGKFDRLPTKDRVAVCVAAAKPIAAHLRTLVPRFIDHLNGDKGLPIVYRNDEIIRIASMRATDCLKEKLAFAKSG